MEELAPLLEQLAAQLNTTVEFLWGVMIRQAQYEFVFFIVGILVILFLYIAIHHVVLRAMIKMEENEENKAMASIIISIIGAFILLLYILINGKSAMVALFNPEYWALQQILEFIR
jgi:uncharacterized integral membrane protein